MRIYNKIILAFVLCVSSSVFSQEQKINWSILIDGKMEKLSNSQIMVEYDDGNINKIPVRLIPGELIMASGRYSEVLEGLNIKNITLKFEFAKVCTEIKYYDYEIPILSSWLSQPYFVLNIYNLDIKSNQKLYMPLPDKNYNYQYEFPNSGSRVIQKKFTKEQKRCMEKN